ncbi:transglycosylase SLT domain-containing protein [Piscinibacter sakaiensis]|uniref:transglycosylase SLT domain-containing protein n=1 Tax=Piscinibacter sakaiensis TaxID=1547922 RepID=UPI003AAF9013
MPSFWKSFVRHVPRNRISAVLVFAAALLLVVWGLTAVLLKPADDGAKRVAALPTERFVGDLGEIRERRVLRALVVPSNSDFFLSGARIEGLQARLLLEFEKQLNRGIRRAEDRVRVQFLPVTFDRLIPELEAGHGDIAAAMLTLTPERERRVAMISAKAMPVNEVVVTHRGSEPVRSIEDLAGREVHVVRGSSYAEHLRELNEVFDEQGLDPVEIHEADSTLIGEDMLELVNAGVVDLTVVDDFKARLWAKVYTDIVIHNDVRLSEGGHVGWAVRKGNPELQASLQQFLRKVRQGTLLGNMLNAQFLGRSESISDPTSPEDRRKLDAVRSLFERYAKRYEFDPLALLAQAYHESGLDQSRRSSRGAVGMMQLLPSTARDPAVGIPNISSIENNVHAGAKYMAYLRDRYFSTDDIPADEQMAFVWAAYNAGPGRVSQMRRLAEKMGLDPNRWWGNVEVAAGRLVGRETVKYVADIHKYQIAYNLLDQHERQRAERTEGG